MATSDNTIFFARPRHPYKSYDDWHELIRLSGFQEIYVDEIPTEGVKDSVYICTPLNGEWENGIQTEARVVLWDLEYRREPLKPIPGVAEIWHMDAAQARLIGAKYVPVGGHPDLRVTDAPRDPLYDVAYYGYFDGVPRRQRIRHDLIQRGVKVSPTGAWGIERDTMLNASRAYLHVHQWEDIPAVPALRMVVAAAYKLPVITETCTDYGIFADGCLGLNYPDIAENVEAWTHNIYAPRVEFLAPLKRQGEHLHQRLCHDLTFRKSVEGAL